MLAIMTLLGLASVYSVYTLFEEDGTNNEEEEPHSGDPDFIGSAEEQRATNSFWAAPVATIFWVALATIPSTVVPVVTLSAAASVVI